MPSPQAAQIAEQINRTMLGKKNRTGVVMARQLAPQPPAFDGNQALFSFCEPSPRAVRTPSRRNHAWLPLVEPDAAASVDLPPEAGESLYRIRCARCGVVALGHASYPGSWRLRFWLHDGQWFEGRPSCKAASPPQ